MPNEIYTYHSMHEFVREVSQHVAQYVRDDSFGTEHLPDQIYSEILGSSSRFCSRYSYPMYAILGLRAQDLAELIGSIFDEVGPMVAGGAEEQIH